MSDETPESVAPEAHATTSADLIGNVLNFTHQSMRFRGRLLALALIVSLVLNVVNGVFAYKASENANNSAISAAKTAGEVKTLLTDGKTTSAENSAAAKKSAAAGEAIIKHVETQLNAIQNRSNVTHDILCNLSAVAHITTPLVTADCSDVGTP